MSISGAPSLSTSLTNIELNDIDILVMGSDWKGKFDDLPCKVVYLDRTPFVSSTLIRGY